MGSADILLLLGLLAVVGTLSTLARALRLPAPILLALGGLGLGFLPNMPPVRLAPDVVLLIFFPPLLYWAGLQGSLRDLRANLRPIALLATLLVVACMAAVAAVAHAAIPGLSWPLAFVLGAILSQPDALTVLGLIERLPLPSRLVTVLEGENLFGDATGLTLYRVAVAAVVTGEFSLGATGLSFLVAAAGGVAVGLGVGWLNNQLQRRLDDPPVQVLLSLLTPFAAWALAERLEASGVLAVVTAGLFVGRRVFVIIPAETRLEGAAVWDVLTTLLEGLLFLLVGLELHGALAGGSGPPLLSLAGTVGLLALTVVVTRFLFVFPAAYLPRWLSRRLRERDPLPPRRQLVIAAWSGVLGGDAMAAALAIPLGVAGGAPFPARDLLLLLTSGVIVTTLVVQGLSLGPLIRRLGVTGDGIAEREEAEARRRVTQAALARLENLAGEDWVPQEGLAKVRASYEHEASDLSAPPDGAHMELHEAVNRLQREVLEAERAESIRLRDEGVIGDDVLRDLQRELDLEEQRLASEAP
jgi:CPA1 family monovalent cation:H+ antiporter